MKDDIHADKKVKLSEILPAMQEVLNREGSVALTITGTSMYPTILGGRDQVVLVRSEQPLKKGDLPLYRRDNGQFILHRIVSVERDGTYTCCGDHQWNKEKGIRSDQILAVTEKICRKGKWFPVNARGYVLWVRFWMRVLPIRKIFIYGISFAGKIKRLFIK